MRSSEVQRRAHPLYDPLASAEARLVAMTFLVAGLIGDLVRWVESVFAQHGYLIMAVLIGGESAGLPLPGETSLLAGAVEAQRGVLVLYWVIAVAAIAAITGDNIGYWVGRRAGRPLLERYGRVVHIRERQLLVLDYFFARHGAKTVFFGRWIALLRVGAALFAGASRMPWGRFALWNALGSVAWAVSIGLLGYFFWASVSTIKGVVGYAGVAAMVAFVIVAFLFVRRAEKHLYERAEQASAVTGGSNGGVTAPEPKDRDAA
jgi:membrane protein DedA with SNARE-associated domain